VHAQRLVHIVESDVVRRRNRLPFPDCGFGFSLIFIGAFLRRGRYGT
jgi:hypothetical protein